MVLENYSDLVWKFRKYVGKYFNWHAILWSTPKCNYTIWKNSMEIIKYNHLIYNMDSAVLRTLLTHYPLQHYLRYNRSYCISSLQVKVTEPLWVHDDKKRYIYIFFAWKTFVFPCKSIVFPQETVFTQNHWNIVLPSTLFSSPILQSLTKHSF